VHCLAGGGGRCTCVESQQLIVIHLKYLRCRTLVLPRRMSERGVLAGAWQRTLSGQNRTRTGVGRVPFNPTRICSTPRLISLDSECGGSTVEGCAILQSQAASLAASGAGNNSGSDLLAAVRRVPLGMDCPNWVVHAYQHWPGTGSSHVARPPWEWATGLSCRLFTLEPGVSCRRTSRRPAAVIRWNLYVPPSEPATQFSHGCPSGTPTCGTESLLH
jgi:hypothetical protein